MDLPLQVLLVLISTALTLALSDESKGRFSLETRFLKVRMPFGKAVQWTVYYAALNLAHVVSLGALP